MSVDAAVIWFAVVLSVLTAMVFGMLPAFRTASARAVDGLRERASTGGSGSLARTTLVGAEVALTVMLLAGAALLARSFLTVTRVSPGFDPANTLAIDVALPTARYPDAAAVARFHRALTDGLSGISGVAAVGVTGALPMSGTPATTMVPDGTRATDSLSADVISATPGYFAAVRVPLRAGRLFEPTDVTGAAPVAIVSEAAARGFWPDLSSPIGRTITMMDWGNPYQAQVVGVVRDGKLPCAHSNGSRFARCAKNQRWLVGARSALTAKTYRGCKWGCRTRLCCKVGESGLLWRSS